MGVILKLIGSWTVHYLQNMTQVQMYHVYHYLSFNQKILPVHMYIAYFI